MAQKVIKVKALLAKILGNMKNPITTSSVMVTGSRAPMSSTNVTAPTVAGYTFICWLTVSTSGWIGSFYYENPVSSSTKIWLAASGNTTGTGNIYCRALYLRSDLA